MINLTTRRARRIDRLFCGVWVLATIALATNVSATLRYVDLNGGSPTPPYTNWTVAATNIQDAVDAANAGDEIVVTNGVYQTGGRIVYGAMSNRVAVTKPVTLRSVNGPAVTVIQGCPNIGDSAVRCVYLTNGATLAGFTLTHGATRSSGDASRERNGGGAWCVSVSAVMSNCVLTGNLANSCGGGAYGGTLNDCTVTGNASAAGGGGGAYYATLNNCTLTGNSAPEGGGAYGGTLNNCALADNSASTAGGGSFSATLNNCALVGNTVTAGSEGGGASWGRLNNCTLTSNRAFSGAGGAFRAILNNCIVYYNTDLNGNGNANTAGCTLNYCCTPGASSGGNFADEPLFMDLAGGDLRLQFNSPCVNSGNNIYPVGASDLAGRPRIVGGAVDVGAYEFQGPYLHVTASDGGAATRDPDQLDYPLGSLVTVTAMPAEGYGFIRWTGDATGSANPLTVVMDTNKNITAVFASTILTLTGQGAGTISSIPDQPFYAVGQPVTLNATAGRWHVFSHWLDGGTNNPRTVTIGESNAYTAVFTPATLLDTVTIGDISRSAPVGMPAVVVDGAFSLTPSASARGTALVALSTTFPGGWLFYTLDGSDPAASGEFYGGEFKVRKTCVLRTIAYNSEFTESVAGDVVYVVILPTLTALTDGGGSVAIEPPAGAYFSNLQAVATATPAPGWKFLQWLGDAAGTNPAVGLSMTRNKTVWAVFGTTLNTAIVGSGSIVSSPVSPWHPYGCRVRLTAVPATGNYLVFWANAGAGQTNNPLNLTVTNANQTATAVFAGLAATQTHALTVIPDGQGQVTLTPPGNRFGINANVKLQAMPDPGQEFLGWTGDANGMENPLVVTMNSNWVIAASFSKRPRLEGEGNPDWLNQNGFRLALTGELGEAYQVFGSTDWSEWVPLGTVTNDWGTMRFVDGTGTNLPQRFYRAVRVSP